MLEQEMDGKSREKLKMNYWIREEDLQYTVLFSVRMYLHALSLLISWTLVSWQPDADGNI